MLSRVWDALWRGVASQLRPPMLWLLVLPLLLALLLWGLAAWWAWTPFRDWVDVQLFGAGGSLTWLVSWSNRWGAGWLGQILASALTLLVLSSAAIATMLVLTAVLAMPAVARFLSRGRYQDVAWQGGWSVGASIWNGLSSLLLFMLGYLITLPLWFIPPLALVVPWLWWSWLTARVMRFDSLAEHASAQERRELIARHRNEYLLLGLAVSALNYIPPLFLITPVLSALVFGHYSLSRLAELRRIALPTSAPLKQ